ncbi:MAG TPA: hypothetical protein VFU11_13865 [Solirubrobacterales bacterium]|nr:hypothetical protein [Solirubrobacterales bacterium]
MLISAPSTAAAGALGSTLHDPPDAELCPVAPGAKEAACSFSQFSLAGESSAGENLTVNGESVVTRWSVRSAEAAPATTAVGLRLRSFAGKSAALTTSRYRSLPLDDPGVHVFATRLPISYGQRLGLDVSVEGTGEGPAAAPIGHAESGIGRLDEWLPPPLLEQEPPTRQLADTELLLHARVEYDYDNDGWGDQSQDGCKWDPRRHSPCLPDETEPRLQLRFAKRQPFLAKRRVFLRVRSNERVSLLLYGTMETRGAASAVIGTFAWIDPGVWRRFSIYMDREPRKTAEKLVAEGGHPWFDAIVIARDRSGNKFMRENLPIRLPER